MYHAFVFLFIFSSSKDKTDNYTNIIYNHVVLLRGIFIILLEKFMKSHTLILDSTSMSQGYTYLHIPMNALCPIALNVDFIGTLL